MEPDINKAAGPCLSNQCFLITESGQTHLSHFLSIHIDDIWKRQERAVQGIDCKRLCSISPDGDSCQSSALSAGHPHYAMPGKRLSMRGLSSLFPDILLQFSGVNERRSSIKM